MCHYCGASVKITGTCPVCGSDELFTETPGTQKVEEELHEQFSPRGCCAWTRIQ